MKVQQQQTHKFLKFIQQLCPQFSEHRTLDVATGKDIGIKFQQHYYKYCPESISTDTLHFWTLIQEILDFNPKQKEVIPVEPDRRETETPEPLEKLLLAFTGLSDCNKSLMSLRTVMMSFTSLVNDQQC